MVSSSVHSLIASAPDRVCVRDDAILSTSVPEMDMMNVG